MIPAHSTACRILVRHFFRDAFMNREEGLGRHGIGSMTLILAGLMVLGTFLTLDVLIKYLLFGFYKFATPYQVWVEKLRYFTFQAAVSGIIVTACARTFPLKWREYAFLSSRPVRPFVQFGAKAMAMGLFVLMISAAYSLPATLTFTLLTTRASGENPIILFFVMMGGSAVQTVAILLLIYLLRLPLGVLERFTWGKPINSIVRGLLPASFISIFFWFPGIYDRLLLNATLEVPGLLWWPPSWMAGGALPASPWLLAGLFLLLPGLVYLGHLGNTLRRFRKGEKQANHVHTRYRKRRLPWPGRLSPFLALFSFFCHTLTRSRRIKSILIFTTTVSLSLGFLPLAHHWARSGIPGNLSLRLASFPLLLNLALVCALRFCAIQEIESGAAWVFRFTHPVSGHPRLALLSAFSLRFMLPLNALMWGLLVTQMPWMAALRLTLFHLGVALVLALIIFLDFPFLPFSFRDVDHEEGVKLSIIRWGIGCLVYYWIMGIAGRIVLVGNKLVPALVLSPIPLIVMMTVILFRSENRTKILFDTADQ